MRFQVPQFTDVEDKIIGPLTLKQFIYLAGCAGICVVLFTFLPTFVAVILSVPVAVFGAALAFYKINNQPFIRMVEYFFKYTITSKLYIWRNDEKKVASKEYMPVMPGSVPKLSQSKLKDLAWSLSVKHNFVTGEEEKEG